MKTLRSSLLVLTAATLLPIFVVATIGAVMLVRHEREVAQRSAQERVRALLGAVDVQLASDAAALQSLARNLTDAEPTAAQLRQLLERIRDERPHWLALDVVPRESAPGPGAVSSGHASVAPVGPRPADGRPGYVVEMARPASPGHPARVLTATVSPEPLRRLLAAQRMPGQGAATILDARQHIVARSTGHDEHVGRPATPGARALIERQGHGHVRGRTVEGHAVDTFFDTSAATGWSVAVGMPAAVIDASAWSLLAGASLLLALGTAGAFVAAHVGGRRIAKPVAELAVRARALGERTPPDEAAPIATSLTELRALGDSIEQAAGALREADAGRRAAMEREHALRLQAEAESRSKDRLLAMLAHELRNPLSAIRLSTAVLRRRLGDSPAAASLDVVDRQSRHLTRLIDDLLDAARIREGKILLHRSVLRLDTLVGDTVAALEDRLDGHPVRVDLHPVEVHGDETRLAQVVFNLVSNAVRYSPAGGPIDIHLVRDEAHAVLQVRDEGEGIAPELMPRLFQLYEQGSDGDRGGLGIGLALVRSIVSLHGGEVGVHSLGRGHGSTFSVRLPLHTTVDAPQAMRSDPPFNQEPDGTVDDTSTKVPG